MSQYARRLAASPGSSLALTIILSLLLGLMLGGLVLRMPGMSATQLGLLAALALVAMVGALVGGVRQILLALLILGIPVLLAFTPVDVEGEQFHAGGAWRTLVLYPYDFPLLLLAAIWFADGLLGRRPAKASLLDVAAIGFILWSVVSIVNSVDPVLSGFEVFRTAKLYLLSLVVAGMVRSRQDLLVVIVALLGSLAAPALVGILQFNEVIASETFTETGRVPGTLDWPNTLGAYAAVILVFAFSLWVTGAGGRRMGALAAAIGIFGLIPLLMASSRGAWVALAVALTASILLSHRAGWLTAGRIARLIPFSAIVLALSSMVGETPFRRLLGTSLQQSQLVDRMDLNVVALSMVSSHPIAGVGINTFTRVMRDYDVGGVTYEFPEPVHNAFLLVAAETGLIGLGLFLLLIVAAFGAALKGARSRDRLISGTSIGVTCGLIVIVTSNLADVHLRTDAIFALFWFLIGVAHAVNSVGVTERSPQVPVIGSRAAAGAGGGAS